MTTTLPDDHVREHDVECQERKLNRAYLFREGYVALVAILFVTIGGGYLVDPATVSRAFAIPSPYDVGVNGLYFLGGLVVLAGLLDRRPAIETAGHVLLVPPLLTAFPFALLELGIRHASTLLLVLFAAASMLRAYGLVSRWQVTG